MMKCVFWRRERSTVKCLKAISLLFWWNFTNVSYLFLPAYFPWSQVRQVSRRRTWQMCLYLVQPGAGRYKNILIWLPASRWDHLPPPLCLLLLLPLIPHGDSSSTWCVALLCSNCFVCYKLELLLILLTATVQYSATENKKNNQPVSIMMRRDTSGWYKV